jgi:predicted acetyltransferase
MGKNRKERDEASIAAPPIKIEAIGIDRREILANLMQFYLYDFSELLPDKPECELLPNGQFGEYPYLEKYFNEPGRVALLIRNDQAIVGFAMLNQVSNCDNHIDFNMAEFFIARKYRRRGFGAAAAREIFTAYRGEWELSVARPNISAQKFWSQTLNLLPSLSPLREIGEPSPTWAVTYRFRT